MNSIKINSLIFEEDIISKMVELCDARRYSPFFSSDYHIVGIKMSSPHFPKKKKEKKASKKEIQNVFFSLFHFFYLSVSF